MKRFEVVGVILERDGLVLLAQRSCSNLAGKWEFPGGKVEPMESHQDALRREIMEELGIDINVGENAGMSNFEVAGKPYSLHCYWATLIRGTPRSKEHQALAWVPIDRILNWDLTPADVPIAERIMKR